uniref:Uncharacterized protein n=1 Tax=Moniliophthora roreri TaxID=221103 RepID=A0A0W0FEW5_MONRR
MPSISILLCSKDSEVTHCTYLRLQNWVVALQLDLVKSNLVLAKNRLNSEPQNSLSELKLEPRNSSLPSGLVELLTLLRK